MRAGVRLRARRPWYARVLLAAHLAVAWASACDSPPDHLQMSGNDTSVSAAAVVRVAFGWRAREVERQSTARIAFSDQDVGAIIVEYEPVALGYAEPQHAFTLPPGRFLRVDQAAGRVYEATATPHLEALTPTAAAALADSVGRLLDRAGWARVPDEGRGEAAAVRDAVRYASDGQGGVGVADVATWRVPRPAAPWATPPADMPARPSYWRGVEARVSVRPVRQVADAADTKLILQVKLTDALLSSAFFAMSEARRAQHGGDMQTLRSWDAQPTEPIPAARPTAPAP